MAWLARESPGHPTARVPASRLIRPDLGKEPPGRFIVGPGLQERLKLPRRFILPARDLEQGKGDVEADLGKARHQPKHLLVLTYRLRGPALRVKRKPQVVVSLGIAWLQTQRLPVLGDRLIQAAGNVRPGIAEIDVRLGEARLQPQGLPEMADGLVRPAGNLHQGGPEIVVRLGEVWLQPQGLLEVADGAVQPAGNPSQGATQVVVRRCKVLFQAEGLLEMGHRLVQLAAILKPYADVVVRLGIILFQAEGLPKMGARLSLASRKWPTASSDRPVIFPRALPRLLFAAAKAFFGRRAFSKWAAVSSSSPRSSSHTPTLLCA